MSGSTGIDGSDGRDGRDGSDNRVETDGSAGVWRSGLLKLNAGLAGSFGDVTGSGSRSGNSISMGNVGKVPWPVAFMTGCWFKPCLRMLDWLSVTAPCNLYLVSR